MPGRGPPLQAGQFTQPRLPTSGLQNITRYLSLLIRTAGRATCYDARESGTPGPPGRCRRRRGVGAAQRRTIHMQAKRWQYLCILAFGLPVVTAAQALRISVYAPAGTVNQYLSTPDDRAKAAGVMERFKVSKIWIEGRRGDQHVTPELLIAARDDFRARGFAVSGGLTTVPGKTFGVQSNPGRTWMNFQAEQTQKEIARFYTENAAIFDEIMVDDFYATEDATAESEKARGNLSWS